MVKINLSQPDLIPTMINKTQEFLEREEEKTLDARIGRELLTHQKNSDDQNWIFLAHYWFRNGCDPFDFEETKIRKMGISLYYHIDKAENSGKIPGGVRESEYEWWSDLECSDLLKIRWRGLVVPEMSEETTKAIVKEGESFRIGSSFLFIENCVVFSLMRIFISYMIDGIYNRIYVRTIILARNDAKL